MAFIVECVRGRPDEPGFETCSSDYGFAAPGLAGSARRLADFAACGGCVFAVDD